jgi:hypothetical protein
LSESCRSRSGVVRRFQREGCTFFDTGEKNFAQLSKCAVAARQHCEDVGILPVRTETKRQTIIMKYALLVYESQESFDRRKDSTSIAAGRAYGEALQAAGVFVGGAGLESPETATTVSLRDGKRHVHDGPYAETKEFLAGFAIIEVPNLDAALEWASRHPAAGHAAVEVRPLGGSHFAVGAKKSS